MAWFNNYCTCPWLMRQLSVVDEVVGDVIEAGCGKPLTPGAVCRAEGYGMLPPGTCEARGGVFMSGGWCEHAVKAKNDEGWRGYDPEVAGEAMRRQRGWSR